MANEQVFKLIDTETAAQYVRDTYGLPLEPTTLTRLRCSGRGPRFLRFGRHVRYRIDMLDDWVNTKLTEHMSTSDHVPASMSESEILQYERAESAKTLKTETSSTAAKTKGSKRKAEVSEGRAA